MPSPCDLPVPDPVGPGLVEGRHASVAFPCQSPAPQLRPGPGVVRGWSLDLAHPIHSSTPSFCWGELPGHLSFLSPTPVLTPSGMASTGATALATVGPSHLSDHRCAVLWPVAAFLEGLLLPGTGAKRGCVESEGVATGPPYPRLPFHQQHCFPVEHFKGMSSSLCGLGSPCPLSRLLVYFEEL